MGRILICDDRLVGNAVENGFPEVAWFCGWVGIDVDVS